MKNYIKVTKRITSMLLLFIILFLGISGTNVTKGAANEWISEGKVRKPLSGAAAHYIGDKIYIIGGHTAPESYINTVSIFDLTTNVWTDGTPMPYSGAYAASVKYDNKIYLFGGDKFANNVSSTTNDVNIYDIKTNSWAKGTPMPLATTYTKAVLYNDKIYIFSGEYHEKGKPNSFHKIIQIYDIKTNSWASDTNIPFARNIYSVELTNDKVYLFGGYDVDKEYDDVNIYDLSSGTWSVGTPMPTQRQLSTSFFHNNIIYLLGGNDSNGLLSSVDTYNTITDSWGKATDMKTAKRGMSTILLDNKLYIIGGHDNISTNPYSFTSAIESLPLPPTDNRLMAHLYINEKTQLSFSHILGDNQSLTWKSSTPSVATVDTDGVVTALDIGTTFISIYNKNGTFVDYIPVIVTENDIYRMAVHLNSGQTQKLYINGNPSGSIWTSMDDSVATVDSNGLVTGIGKGLVLVKATFDEEEHYIYVRVD